MNAREKLRAEQIAWWRELRQMENDRDWARSAGDHTKANQLDWDIKALREKYDASVDMLCALTGDHPRYYYSAG